MVTRRQFIKTASGLLGSMALGQQMGAVNGANLDSALQTFMPDESAPHLGTWMAFVANKQIWSKRQVAEVKRNLALIAQTIANYEPVFMLVNEADRSEAIAHVLPDKHRYPVQLISCKVDDLWLRDTGPTFVTNSAGAIAGIDFNFNGWGNKQFHANDAKIARFITGYVGARIETPLVLEGGCFEVDGHGTAILTKSCILNDNRNPNLTQKEVEQMLSNLLGLRKIIWLDGIKDKDITDGHTDFYARFTHPGAVFVSRDNDPDSYDYTVTRNNIIRLNNSTDANGNKLRVTVIDTPNRINERYGVQDFAAGYIGYYVCNGAVIAQKFGDSVADNRVEMLLQQTFPDRTIEQISIDGIASGGGSIHCATQQMIKPS